MFPLKNLARKELMKDCSISSVLALEILTYNIYKLNMFLTSWMMTFNDLYYFNIDQGPKISIHIDVCSN